MDNLNKYELTAKRWAKALFELVSEDKNISKEKILGELREAAAIIKNSKELSNAITNPSISTEEKQVVLCKLFQNRVSPIVYNFLYVMNLKKRLSIICLAANEFQRELEHSTGTVRVNVTSAIELTKIKQNEIKTKIENKLKKNISINWGVDEDIIAGLIFNIDGTIIDNSIKHKLEDLSKTIVKV